MFDEEEGIKIISSARHMILNQLQLIKGYLYMKQPLKANTIVDRLTEELREQSRLSHLRIPKTAFFLLTSGWTALPFKQFLHVRYGEQEDVFMQRSGEEKATADLSVYDSELENFFRNLFNIYKQYASEKLENRVELLFDMSEQTSKIQCVFSGVLNEELTALSQVRQLRLNQSLEWEENYNKITTEEQRMRWSLCLSIK
ncbi:MAG: Spo0B domain-containing protein [Sporolactobacillus sp.]